MASPPPETPSALAPPAAPPSAKPAEPEVPGAALVRTHDLARDLTWLGGGLRHLRLLRYLFAGGAITGLVALAVVLGMTAQLGSLVYAFMLLGGATGYAGDRLARRLVRRRLDRLARGLAEVRALSREDEGTTVRVRGRVRATTTVPSLLSPGERGVFCRAVLFFRGQRAVHERACDFALVGEDGEHIHVLVDGARLLVPDPPARAQPPELLDVIAALPLENGPAGYCLYMQRRRAKGKSYRAPSAGELLLRDGDEVWVLGEKTQVLDATVHHLERQTPLRATLRGGRDLPLLIAPVTPDERRLPEPPRQLALPPAGERHG